MPLQACAVVDHDGAFSGGASHSLAFPLVRGGHTLTTVIRKLARERRYLPLDVLIYIVQQPLDTITDMHARDVLHLDLVRHFPCATHSVRRTCSCLMQQLCGPCCECLPASALDAHAVSRALRSCT